ncbi:MAG: hypothetical protein PHX08_16645 [Lachnospiraceae bacterium]|nr:hypothetical protein [Lachnospiraceae bacterium]
MAESLIGYEESIKLAAKSEYKYKSVVSTPIEIIKYMVKTTLDLLWENTRKNQTT